MTTKRQSGIYLLFFIFDHYKVNCRSNVIFLDKKKVPVCLFVSLVQLINLTRRKNVCAEFAVLHWYYSVCLFG